MAAQTADGFRFYNAKTDSHFFTTDASEAAQIATMADYKAEGAPWTTADKAGDTTDVFRFYDAKTGDHFYTTSAAERDAVLQSGSSYHYEGVGFQAYAAEGAAGTEVLERFYNAGTGMHHYALADEAAGLPLHVRPPHDDNAQRLAVHGPGELAGPDLLAGEGARCELAADVEHGARARQLLQVHA